MEDDFVLLLGWANDMLGDGHMPRQVRDAYFRFFFPHGSGGFDDFKRNAFLRELENRERSGRAFIFETEWPPGYEPTMH